MLIAGVAKASIEGIFGPDAGQICRFCDAFGILRPVGNGILWHYLPCILLKKQLFGRKTGSVKLNGRVRLRDSQTTM
jgi:hypothetical protein